MARSGRSFCEADNPTQQQDRLLKFVDGAIFAAIVCAPLVMGGRHAWGHLALVAIIMSATTGWLVRQFILKKTRYRFTGIEWLLLAGTSLVLLQLAPLPPSFLSRLSPAIGQYLSLWSVNTGSPAFLGTWETGSVNPE